MIARLRRHPAALLTRHFFHALFDFGVFSQEGADSFVRVVIGIIAALIALGMLLRRMYAMKYGELVAARSAEPYARALLADTTVVIALPMWIVAFVTVLVSQSLFPDETDFRVLMPLPIDRSVVFGAKLLALGLFAGLFTLITWRSPIVLLMSMNRWAVDGVVQVFSPAGSSAAARPSSYTRGCGGKAPADRLHAAPRVHHAAG